MTTTSTESTEGLQTATILNPFDGHVHWRQLWNSDGAHGLLPRVIRATERLFAGALPMPNLRYRPGVTVNDKPEGIVDGVELAAYQGDIEQHLFRPDTFCHWVLKLVSGYTTPAIVRDAMKVGARGFKLYPFSEKHGGTTNIASGVNLAKLKELYPVFAEMQKLELTLHIHGMDPDAEPLYGEEAFLPLYKQLCRDFPKLVIVFEHVTTEQGVKAVLEMHGRGYPTYATVTVHHLYQTHADYMGAKFRPWEYSLPPARFVADRAALRGAVVNHPHIFYFGSDSAPHEEGNKHCCSGAPGVYSAPHALEHIVQFFDEAGALEWLQVFVSDTAFRVLRLNEIAQRDRLVTLVKRPHVIPETDPQAPGIRLFRRGETCAWQIQE